MNQEQNGRPDRTGSSLDNAVSRVVIIGASMGGPDALERILSDFPADCEPTIIVQHLPQNMAPALARRFQRTCKAEVRVAEGGQVLHRGLVLVAPGGKHAVLRRVGTQYYVVVKDGPKFNYQRPSVDVTFRSAARHVGKLAVGVLLTGMGTDGARGLKLLRDAGAVTIVQNEQTCLIFGMPKAAIEQGAAGHVLPLDVIAGKIMSLSRNKKRTARPVSADTLRDVAIPGIPAGSLKPLWMAGVLFKVDYKGKRNILFN